MDKYVSLLPKTIQGAYKPTSFIMRYSAQAGEYVPLDSLLGNITSETYVVFPHMFLALKNIKNEIMYLKNLIEYL